MYILEIIPQIMMVNIPVIPLKIPHTPWYSYLLSHPCFSIPKQASVCFCSWPISFIFWNTIQMKSSSGTFLSGFFSLSTVMLTFRRVVCVRSSLSRIPVVCYSYVNRSLVVPSIWWLQVEPLWPFMYKSSYGHGFILRVELRVKIEEWNGWDIWLVYI